MDHTYKYFDVENHGPSCVVRLLPLHYDESLLDPMGAELARLLDVEGYRNIVLSLGPDDPDCLQSVFLAKLLNLKKRLEQGGGALLLTDLSEHTRHILQVVGLHKHFRCYDNVEAALKALAI
jgi:anti-anti-sigma regulatory factor